MPLEDGDCSLVQIVEIIPDVLNSITCAFYDVRQSSVSRISASAPKPISIQFVTKDLIAGGRWAYTESDLAPVPEDALPYRDSEADGWIGAKVIASGIIEKFLSAFYGLRRWDEMAGPAYYQSLLLATVEPHAIEK